MYEAVWVRRFEATECWDRVDETHVALVPDLFGGADIIAAFRNKADALAFGKLKAEELKLPLINFVIKGEENEQTT